MGYNTKNYIVQGGERTVIEGELVIAEGGKLLFNEQELKPLVFQADSTAGTVAGLKDDLNALLLKLKEAGVMASE
ncbi:MAG: Head fiber protein [Clostridia bacterium]|nr:Head fiber protein [Clostridia bacterium]